METLTYDLGNRIRKRRKELNLTQEDLAELSDLSVNFLSQLERTNNQNISIQKLDSIAQALNTTIEELISTSSNNNHDFVSKENDRYFLNKLITELRKLPNKKAENISKHLLFIIRDLKG
ncbi:FIG00745919: hypothetical protein [Limosilactobacillus reuteri]|uniref:HTH cro/C1-type domain-containing protein n=1 Tax=Limosilactobacillus reuteri TaxID=1598 RepID=A0A0U5FAI5_LIMRT|nr:FIG00745919: hypothetical protein [Limosilactobacillus reuteri]